MFGMHWLQGRDLFTEYLENKREQIVLDFWWSKGYANWKHND